MWYRNIPEGKPEKVPFESQKNTLATMAFLVPRRSIQLVLLNSQPFFLFSNNPVTEKNIT